MLTESTTDTFGRFIESLTDAWQAGAHASTEQWQTATGQLRQMGAASQATGALGIARLIDGAADNLAAIADSFARQAPHPASTRVEALMLALADLLAVPDDEEVQSAAIAVLADKAWPLPISQIEQELCSELMKSYARDLEAAGLTPEQGLSGTRQYGLDDPEAPWTLDPNPPGDPPSLIDTTEPALPPSGAVADTPRDGSDANEFLLAGIERISGILTGPAPAEDLTNELFVLAQAAGETGFSTLEGTCLSLAEAIAGGLWSNQGNLLNEALPLALIDAFSGDDTSAKILMATLQASSRPAGEAAPTISANFPAEQSDSCGAPLASTTLASAALANPEARQTIGRDMLAVLADELSVVESQVNQAIDAVKASGYGDGGAQKRTDEATALMELFERLAGACSAIGLSALAEFTQLFSSLAVDSLIRQPSVAEIELLEQFAADIRAYCIAPDDHAVCQDLVGKLCHPAWATPCRREDAAALAQRMSDVLVTAATADPRPPRATEATAEDVSLDVPTDIIPELLDGLLQELPVQTTAFSRAILKLAGGQGAPADLEIAKRAAHTLKGAANTVGIPGIAILTHHLEDILMALGDAEVMPGAGVSRLLIEAGDCLEAMNETLLGTAPAPADRLDVLQRVLDLANRIDAEGIPEEEPAGPDLGAPASGERSRVPAPAAAVAVATAAAEATPMVRIPARLIDELLQLVGESMISAAQMREQLTLARATTHRLKSHNQNFQRLVAELEHMVDIRGLGLSAATKPANNENGSFDELEFEEYNELQTLSRQLTEAVTDARELTLEEEAQLERLGEGIEQQHRLQLDVQDMVMRTRMIPAATLEPRLHRAARQTSRLLDKEIEFDIQGGETPMDSYVLQALADPLMHVLRNAIDHGIETPGERHAAGKPRVGTLRLTFSREGNSIVVRCRDDGRGLDYDAIRRKAEALKLVAPEQYLSQDEIAHLILRHGFSTRDEASQVSGRGIGMDAVLAAIRELKGSLFLQSATGAGLTVEMRLPVSLVANHALLVSSQNQKFAISTGGIQDLLYLDDADIQQVEDMTIATINQRPVPLVELEALLDLPPDRRKNARQGHPILLVQLDTGALKAVRVNNVIDSRDIVVKNVSRYLPPIPGVIGATILGDGNVASVIDLRALARFADESNRPVGQFGAGASETALPDLPTALVVDDSLSARRNTAQLMRDSGFEVRAAIDGMEAVSILEHWTPDIILTDMEMPRMNGLELAALVRSRDASRKTPIVMITSRSTEKHRQQATKAGVSIYLVKPFRDEELIDQVFALLA